MKGYKVFAPDWTCKGFQYEVGKTYEMAETPKACSRGFHFCEKAVDCFHCYDFSPENKVAEVEALGKIDTNGIKSCTNRLRIVRELSWYEVLDLVNTGKCCMGIGNTGDENTGSWNSGRRNTGHMNSGDWNSGIGNSGCNNTGYKNSGDRNTGGRNTGNENTGNRNSGNGNSGRGNAGDRNTGNRNSGNNNSGDWNLTDHSSGCFNTKSPSFLMFDAPTGWTYADWCKSDACNILCGMPWRVGLNSCNDMPDEAEYKKAVQAWWDDLDEAEKAIVKALPNFDAVIFEKCTGIKV